MFVKICGITRREDALAAARFGASAVGFVFWRASPRFVDPDTAAAIRAVIPDGVQVVGVFVDQAVDEINAVADRVQLSAVQLHGGEDVAFAARVCRPVIKAVTLEGETLAGWPDGTLLLIDAHDPIRRGGTGRVIDWSTAAAVAGRRRVLLAGGLSPENVREAIARVRPFGIDVSSGVESAPGIKDQARLRKLFDAVASAERAGEPAGEHER
jgi:phosphoribosylanthranilate isomerase